MSVRFIYNGRCFVAYVPFPFAPIYLLSTKICVNRDMMRWHCLFSRGKMKEQVLLQFLIQQLYIYSINGANILYVDAMASPSHHIWNSVLAQGLVLKGHNLTVLGAKENAKNYQNYTYITLEGIYQGLDELDYTAIAAMSTLQNIQYFEEWCIHQCGHYLKTQGLKSLLDYPKDFKFDLIIVDLSAGPCLLSLAHRFNYPDIVEVTPFLIPPELAFVYGNDLNPSYQPHYQLLHSTEMNFRERVWNFIVTYFDILTRNRRQYGVATALARPVIGQNLPDLEEIERNISLLLSNTDPVLHLPLPLTPNIIPVGGLHTRKSKRLTPDLQGILDNAINGVIILSLGTNIRWKQIDSKIPSAFLNAFAQRSETVIWKCDIDFNVDELPPNVIIRKWLPQNDVLGHPNVKLFIGHGGALSTQEAIFHGVPMLAIPFFLDQKTTSLMIAKKSIGLSLELKKITKEYVSNALDEIVKNPKYKTTMQGLSKVFRSRPETPLERAIYWIEYILKNGPVHYLSPSSRNMSFIQRLNLDIISFLFVSVLIILYLLYKIVLICYCVLSQRKLHRKIKSQ